MAAEDKEFNETLISEVSITINMYINNEISICGLYMALYALLFMDQRGRNLLAFLLCGRSICPIARNINLNEENGILGAEFTRMVAQ